MAKHKKASKVSILKRKKTFSYLQIVIFALIFGAVGVYAIVQSGAAPAKGKNATAGTASVWIIPRNGADANNMKYNDTFTPGFTVTNISFFKASLGSYVHCWAKPDGSTILGSTPPAGYTQGQPIWSSARSLDPNTGGMTVEGSFFELNGGLERYWIGGGADCTLELVKLEGTVTKGTYEKVTVLAKHSFSVAP